MTVRYEARGAIAVLTIDRPERRNAVDRATAAALLEGYLRFEADPALAVLIMTGAGNEAFCAGADLKALDNETQSAAGPMGFTRLIAKKPVIAAIEGYCVAGGLEIALFCDLRVAGRSARFGCLERRFGVPLIDGGTQRLPRVVGLGRALDLVLTGRLIDGVEAERIGLVNRVVDDGQALDSALELAAHLLEYPWACLLADRLSLIEGVGRPLVEGLVIEAERGASLDVAKEALAGAGRFSGGAGRHGR
jgi:enoyl-CoA hydratase